MVKEKRPLPVASISELDCLKILETQLKFFLKQQRRQRQLQRQQQEQSPSNNSADKNNDNRNSMVMPQPSPMIICQNQEQQTDNVAMIDQVMRVLDSIFAGQHIVESAMTVLDAAETNITRVKSLSSQRTLFLVHRSSSSSSWSSSHYHHQQQHQQQGTTTTTTTNKASFSPSLYYVCLLPDWAQPDYNSLEEDYDDDDDHDDDDDDDDSSIYYCSCRSYFDKNSSTCPTATTFNRYNHRHSLPPPPQKEAKSFLCKHLLALLLVPILGVTTAELELSNDADFCELILSRIH